MEIPVQFGLLGPLEVRSGGAEMTIAPGKQRAVLAALLLNAGRVVPVDELGAEPGAELRELHQRILAADPGLAAPAVETGLAADPMRGSVEDDVLRCSLRLLSAFSDAATPSRRPLSTRLASR